MADLKKKLDEAEVRYKKGIEGIHMRRGAPLRKGIKEPDFLQGGGLDEVSLTREFRKQQEEIEQEAERWKKED